MKVLAKGNSMYPVLQDGCYYEMKSVENHDFKKGDIIVFKIENSYICHRLVKMIKTRNGKCFYKTKGDNCEKADGFVVLSDMIVGIIAEDRCSFESIRS